MNKYEILHHINNSGTGQFSLIQDELVLLEESKPFAHGIEKNRLLWRNISAFPREKVSNQRRLGTNNSHEGSDM